MTVSDRSNVTGTSTVLCIDDEPNILSAMKRVLRPTGCRVLTAEGGAAALSCMEEQSVDLIICDMRMPEMDGPAVLAEVATRWPDTVRFLMTGYEDLESTVEAVNRGQIYRYVHKPWDDTEVVIAVQRALEHQSVERERAALLDLTRHQNEELREFNATLEAKVEARMEELRQLTGMLEKANVS